MPAFVAYYRISKPKRDRRTGEPVPTDFGMEAQRAAVAAYLAAEGGDLVAEFTEYETGRKTDKQRPQLAAALDACRQRRARLVVAKLDRLGRDNAFLAALLASKQRPVFVDMPGADLTMLQLLAVFAEYERRMIGQRTREALARVKASGVQLGNPNPLPALERAWEVTRRAARPTRERVRPTAQRMRAEGMTLREIAAELNALQVPTATEGARWYASTVRNLLASPTPLPYAAGIQEADA